MYIIVNAKTRENVLDRTFLSLFGAYKWADCLREECGKPCIIEYRDKQNVPRGEWDLYATPPTVSVNRDYGQRDPINIDDNLMGTFVSYMDNDLREQLHAELCPCTNEEFLYSYAELDTGFEEILESEFELEVRLV